MRQERKNRNGKLAWVFQFIGYHLETFGEKRWLEFWNDEISLFLANGWEPLGGWHTDRDKAQAMQQAAREYITQVADHQGPSSPLWQPPVLAVEAKDIRGVTFCALRTPPAIPRADSLLTAFKLRLCDLLTDLKKDEIRRCGECQLIFHAGHGSQKFCSKVCANRDAGRQFRERERMKAFDASAGFRYQRLPSRKTK